MSILRAYKLPDKFNFISSSFSLVAVMIWHVIKYVLKNRRHPLPESNSTKSLPYRMIFPLVNMKEVMSFKARGKGGFFFPKGNKAQKGVKCELRRDESNEHGNTGHLNLH